MLRPDASAPSSPKREDPTTLNSLFLPVGRVHVAGKGSFLSQPPPFLSLSGLSALVSCLTLVTGSHQGVSRERLEREADLVDDEAGKEEAGRHLSVKVLATRLKHLDFILQATRSD